MRINVGGTICQHPMIGGAELLGSGSYDLVIADGRLPDGNGMAVAEKAGKAGAKALIITGYALSLSSRPLRGSIEAGAPPRVNRGGKADDRRLTGSAAEPA